MGSPNSEPGRDDDEYQHSVSIPRPFYMQTTEVTVGQWRSFVNAVGYMTQSEQNGYTLIWTGTKWVKRDRADWRNPGFPQTEEHPVTCVSWNDVSQFISWINQADRGRVYRLPTEAEWEYACRAGTTTPLFNGRISDLDCGFDPGFDYVGWYCGNSNGRTHPVAQKMPNTFGLFDMHGNVWEWVQEFNNGTNRVVRGGSWNFGAKYGRSGNRGNFPQSQGFLSGGFRLVSNTAP